MEKAISSGVLDSKISEWLADPGKNPSLIFDNKYAQPLICLYQVMVMAVIKESIPEVDLWAGYSLGELSAYGCAGAFELPDILRLCQTRADAMSSACKDGAMAAVIGLHEKEIDDICKKNGTFIAIINGPDHFIIGGLEQNITATIADCEKSGASKTVRLNISIPSHTPLMTPAVEPFRTELRSLRCTLPQNPLLAGISGSEVFTAEQMENALCGQMHQTVNWHKCLEAARDYGCRVFLELGPGKSLAAMVLDAHKYIEARSVSEFKDISRIGQWVKSALSRQE